MNLVAIYNARCWALARTNTEIENMIAEKGKPRSYQWSEIGSAAYDYEYGRELDVILKERQDMKRRLSTLRRNIRAAMIVLRNQRLSGSKEVEAKAKFESSIDEYTDCVVKETIEWMCYGSSTKPMDEAVAIFVKSLTGKGMRDGAA